MIPCRGFADAGRLARLIEACIAAQPTTRRNATVANSKQVGGLVGPTLVAVLVSEFPLVQPNLYDAQIPPVIYLAGVLMFAASQYQQASQGASSMTFMVLEGFFLVVALIITFKSYNSNSA
jgi:hypothetical protein